MPRLLSGLLVVALSVTGPVYALTPEARAAMDDVQALHAKVKSFSADLQVSDKQSAKEQLTTSTLTLSKDYGWRIRSSTAEGPYEFLSDFKSFYQIYPPEGKAYKTMADGPQAEAIFRKPVTDLNPLTLLDPGTIKFNGKKDLNGESVYHFEGTTSTQLLPQGKPVERKMEAWISAKDGLPRKTIEAVGPATATTSYSNVQVNPGLTPEDFEFKPEPGIQVIDANEQMRNAQPQGKTAAPAPATTPKP